MTTEERLVKVERELGHAKQRSRWLLVDLAVGLGVLALVCSSAANAPRAEAQGAVGGAAEGQDPTDELRILQAENNMLKRQRQADIERINALKKEIESLKKPLEEEINALKKEIESLKKPLEEEIAVLKSRVAELEKENATLRAIKALAERVGTVKVVPVLGDETPLTKVKANPQDYVGKKFIVAGGLTVRDYYNYSYSGAKETHVSLRLAEMRADGTFTGEKINVYLQHSLSGELVDAVTKAVGGGYDALLVRVKVTLLPHKYETDPKWDLMELLDWQFRNAEGTGWQPWALADEKQKEDRR